MPKGEVGHPYLIEFSNTTNERKDAMSITATLLKNTAPQSAWLITVKDAATGNERHAARTTLGAAKRTAVEFANSMGDLDRTRLPWETIPQEIEGVQYLRAEVEA